MQKVKELLWRVIILMVGLTIAHLGVTMFLLADLGADPFNVLVQGLLRAGEVGTGWTFLSHGRVHIAVCFLIILVLLFVDRSYIRIGTVLCMIFGGPIIDLFTLLLGPLFSSIDSFVVKLGLLALGCVILAYGMTIVIKSEAGTGPNDLVAVVLSDKLHKKFSLLRVIVDCSFVLCGWLLGGVFGVGTLVCAFLVGPVAGVFLPVNEKLINGLLGKLGVVKQAESAGQ